MIEFCLLFFFILEGINTEMFGSVDSTKQNSVCNGNSLNDLPIMLISSFRQLSSFELNGSLPLDLHIVCKKQIELQLEIGILVHKWDAKWKMIRTAFSQIIPRGHSYTGGV